MSSIKIHRKGEKISLPIKYDFKYKVLSDSGYEKPLMRQDIIYNDELLVFKLENGLVKKTTKEHRCNLILKDNIEQAIEASEVEVGDTFKTKDGNYKVISITKEEYKGNTVDFTMPNDKFYANDILTRNCRLRLDLREIRKNVTGGLFGAADNTGSVGVVTINMPRIGFLENTKEHFFARLDRVMTHAKDALEIKRKQLDVWHEGGLYPYTKRYLTAGFKNHFSTIGLVGMNECCQNFLGKDIGTKEGQAFAVEVLEHMRDKLSDFQEETGNLYNLESTPAESTCYRLAKHDKEKYPAIITAGMNNENPYYTNSTNLPVGYTDDPWKAIKHQEKIQKIYSGGTTFHTYLGESITDWTKTADFIKKVMENTELPYLTISPNYSICETHGYIRGSHTKCPTCEAEQRQAYEEALKKLDIKEAEILAQVDSCCK